MNTTNWSNPIPACPIQAVTVAADGPNGWALSLSGELYYYKAADQIWEEIPHPNDYTITKISSGPDSSLMAITSNNETYQYLGGGWTLIFPLGVMHVGVGDASRYLIGDTNGGVTRYMNGTQMTIGSDWMSDIGQLSTVPEMDHIWCNTNTLIWDNVFYWGGDWKIIPGKNLQQLDLHHNVNTGALQVVGVDSVGGGWMWEMSTGAWLSIPKVTFGAPFACLESSEGYVWAVSNTGSATNNVFRGTFNQ